MSCAPRIVEHLPANRLGRYIHRLVQSEGQSTADWGIYARNLKTSKVLVEYNADKLFLPASNTKLYTTSAALELLKPGFRYVTPIMATGPVRDSVLTGDLIVVGVGDPTWSGRFHEDDGTRVFQGWADSLKALGVGVIAGDIVGVDAVFDDFLLGSGWSWDNESYYYSAQVTGLSFNENTLNVTIEPSESGQSPTIVTNPLTSYVTIENRLVTLDTLAWLDSLGLLDSLALVDTLMLPDSLVFPEPNWDLNRPRGTNRIIFKGILLPDTIETGASVEDPVTYTATVLKETLMREGINVQGGIRGISLFQDETGAEVAEADTLFLYHSPPLRDIIYYLNKDSQNFMAETLLRTIGILAGNGGSARSGLNLARQVWAEMGVDTNSTFLVDGSGLSRYNKLTPRNTVRLLTYMSGDSTFIRSLPIAGVNGTLEKQMKNTAAEGRVFAKTGTLMHVRSLSGYAVNLKGDWIVFSIMVNDFLTPLSEVNDKIARLCELLVLQ
ncbi:MAG: D-alanyl-D-alanine carboxypeptidase/D-alanyl-D-alanine-endopeptidase [Fidelibacterota bacterium]|nr:MAG: D-alanyl-D-alanine carboxypeptidase/D-alanyl-D-alanine-endopeptidase [Candidatus Neomarinimicrobiota bacterium]